ncbi:hemolysin family protein [Ciceribacter sp. L1K22]|uniref:hemolysin family protein n=1 Tax=Ciceribacter sp. L1K22 TaxID=2820275 RepID=UPI001ABEB990|nr:hemolysin family protein [Ciceribacter sp. L1K22]MBO3758815.1 HlyC/CorC family transporter [Ciceribacter sp. L1K22]
MNDYSTKTASKASETGDTSSDDGSSSSTGRPEPAARAITSFWTRAARLLRPQQASSLRENLTDALLADPGIGDVFSPEERAMLNNILRFREVRVEDVMVPRADIDAVDQSITIGDLMTAFEETGRSRMPVYSDTLDDPRGMVHLRDLLAYVTKQARNKRRPASRPADAAAKAEKPARAPRATFDLGRVDLLKPVSEAGIIRPILFVPPSMHASDLLQRMQAARTQIALVIDEYGGTDGLVSHEDIVEMVVGDIDDEHDDEEAMFTRISEDVFVADARIELEEIADAIGPDFDIRDKLDDVDTLGGLIFATLGRIPVRGEVVQATPGFEFHILEADPRRIKRIRIIRKRLAVRRRLSKGESENQPAAGREDAAPEDKAEQSMPAANAST